MSSLTEAASFSRKAFKWVLVSIGVLLFLVVLFLVGKAIWKAVFPPSPTPPTIAFDKLPVFDLSEGIKNTGIEFRIETITGDLPVLSSRAKVFRISEGDTTFGRIEKIKTLAAGLGFGKNPRVVGDNLYEFVDSRDEGRVFSIDIMDLNFNLESQFYNDTSVIGRSPGSEKDAIENTYNLFKQYNFDPKNFPENKATTRTLRIDGNKLVEVPSLSGASLIEVSFSRSEIDKLEVITPRQNLATAQALVAASKIVSAKLGKQDIELNKFATYPLKGTQAAFNDLKAGKGAFNKEIGEGAFPIREVTIGYIEGVKHQDYLQPVYLFKSDSGLIAYVNAVSDSFIK